MSKNVVILLLGTNLGEKKKNLENAILNIKNKVGNVIEVSNVLENKAEEFTSDNLFLNQKLKILTNLSPIQLLHTIKDIEYSLGRKYLEPIKNEKYTDRLIDIDILYFNNITYKNNKLKIPHNQVFTRDFINGLVFVNDF